MSNRTYSSLKSEERVQFFEQRAVLPLKMGTLRDGAIGAEESPEDARRSARRLARLTRAGLFGRNTLGARIEQATTFQELQQAYRLVHDVYVEAGYIRPDTSGIRLRMFEASPDEATFVAKVGERIVGVVSVASDSTGLGLPSDSCFKKELDELRSTGAFLSEMTNQAIVPDFRKSGVATELMRCAAAHVISGRFDETIAVISPNHCPFYKILGFREVGTPRSYSATVYDPVVALSTELGQYRRAVSDTEDEAYRFVHEFMAGGNPFMLQVEEWARKAAVQFRDSQLLRRLFISETAFITTCSNADLEFLKRIWGRRLFNSVTGRSLLTRAKTWSSALLDIFKIVDDNRSLASEVR